MDRGALIGGAAVLAALGGVVAFYFVISSGDTGEVGAYERQQHDVERLVDRSGNPVDVRSGEKAVAADGRKRIDVSNLPKTSGPLPKSADPEAAEKWRKARAEARARDKKVAMSQLDEFFAQAEVGESTQNAMNELFEQNFAKRDAIRKEIESGKLSPRVGRQKLAEQRDMMKRAVIDEVGTEGFENVRIRMDKARIVVF